MKPPRAKSPNSQPSFYWYDIETSGTSTKHDRIIQFACQRTNEDLEPISDPWSRLVKLPPQVLLKPRAALITGLGPAILERDGVEEWELLRDVSQQFTQPKTCLIGFNNIAFDDEFLRYGMYRNLRPPYDHEWKNGNSRLDVMSIAQLTCALRPAGLNWPTKGDAPSFKLEEIARANGFDTSSAHDALTDVNLTLGIARKIKKAQPKLWDFACSLRSRETVSKYVTPNGRKPILHVSTHYSNKRFCIAPVLPIAEHPKIRNQVIVVDLLSDLSLILKQTAEAIRSGLFAQREENESERARPGIHTIALNRAPVIAPMSVLLDEDAERLNINRKAVNEAVVTLANCTDLPQRLREVYISPREFDVASVAEDALYDGFIPNGDARLCRNFWNRLESGAPWEDIRFGDSRLNDLADRLKTRIAPNLMHENERSKYFDFVKRQLTDSEDNLSALRKEVREMLSQSPSRKDALVLAELDSHMDELANSYGI